jgi:hypothetical protein
MLRHCLIHQPELISVCTQAHPISGSMHTACQHHAHHAQLTAAHHPDQAHLTVHAWRSQPVVCFSPVSQPLNNEFLPCRQSHDDVTCVLTGANVGAGTPCQPHTHSLDAVWMHHHYVHTTLCAYRHSLPASTPTVWVYAHDSITNQTHTAS